MDIGWSQLVVGDESRGGGMKESAGSRQRRGRVCAVSGADNRPGLSGGRVQRWCGEAGRGRGLQARLQASGRRWEPPSGEASDSHAHFRGSTGGSIKVVAK